MIAIKDQSLQMLKKLSADELVELAASLPEEPQRSLGRKKRPDEKYQHIGITVPPELEQQLLTLMTRERCKMSELIRGLIRIGLDEHANGRAIDTRS